MAGRVRVKICGITHPDDLDDAVAAGADAVGSELPPALAALRHSRTGRGAARHLPPFVEPVGVFVRHTLAAVRRHLESLARIRVVQVHGGPPEVVAAAPLVHVPAFQVRDAGRPRRDHGLPDACKAADAMPGAILVDGYAPGLVGGTGRPRRGICSRVSRRACR